MHVTFKLRTAFNILAILLMLLMMIFQAQFYSIKIIILALMLVLLPPKIRVSRNLLFFLFFLVSYALWGVTSGLCNVTDNPLSTISVVLIWPLLFTLYITQINTERDYNSLLIYMYIGHTFLILYDILFAFSVIYGFSFPNIYNNIDIGFSFYETTSRLNFTNLNILSFTFPVYFTLYIANYEFGINKIIQFIMLLLCMFLFVLSGRRSVMLLFCIVPVCLYVLTYGFPEDIRSSIKMKLKYLIVIILSIICLTYVLYPEVVEGYWDTLIMAFDSDKEPTKFVQQEMLLGHFFESPIYGKGFGSFFYEPFPGRMQYSDEFELQYHLRLATTGIIGFILYMIATWGTVICGLYLSHKRSDIIFYSFSIGLLFILILDATNPVMGSFDLMLPLYFCWAKINTDIF